MRHSSLLLCNGLLYIISKSDTVHKQPVLNKDCLVVLFKLYHDMHNNLGVDRTVKTFQGITGNIGIWLFHFLTDRFHFVRLPGGIIEDHPVLNGVPQETVLGPLLFFIMISDIDKDASTSKLVTFADDTHWRIQKKLHQVSHQGNLFKELTSEKYLSVIRCPILRLAVILMMFIKHSSSYYVSWHSSATLNPTATDLLQ